MFIIDKLKKIIKIEMNNSYQKQIIKNTEKFRPKPKYPVYPPYHEGLYIEDYFFNYFIKNKIKTDRIYIPIFWTSCYNNNEKFDIQLYLDTLDPNLKYFTICQHEHAPAEILPKNTLVFSASGKIYEKNKSNNYIPIPLICSKIKNVNKDKPKDIFCSFVGANTHKIRVDLENQLNKFKKNKNYYFEMDKWESNISKSKEINFKDITERSVFTLCPRGDGPTSFRLYESMQLGSIPVYVYNSTKWIPYENELNWLNLCVFIHEKEIPNLQNILENISQERIDYMKSEINKIYDDWFTLESMSDKIIFKLKNEKMRLLTFYSDSHDILFKNYFYPSVKRIDEYNIIPQRFEQIGTGSFMELGWKEIMFKKLEFILQSINECWYDNFVFADADVMFIDKTINFLKNELGNYDVAFQRDINDLCAGFFIMKANESSLNFIENCIKKYNEYPEDQTAMRMNKSLVKCKLLPDEIFNIGMINDGKVWDGELYYKIPQNMLAFHANWSIGVKAKIDLFNFIIDSLIKTIDLTFLKNKNDEVYFYRFNDGSIFVGNLRGSRMSGGYYLKDENEILFLDNKNNNKKLKVNVYFNFYKTTIDKRDKEIQYCLNELISNNKVDKIYLLCSDEYEESLTEKIVKIDMFNIQPTYNDIFNIVNFNTKKDDLNILLNSDCFIDEENVDLILNNIESKTVFCLSRWDITKLKPFKAEHYDLDCSQDAWIFFGEMKNLDSNFKMGVPGCDNAIAYEFEKSGYRIVNPSKDIKIYHNHFSDIRTYGVSHAEKEKNRVRRPYKFISSSFLNKKINSENINSENISLVSNEIELPILPKILNENILNSFVDNIYCINLQRRKDKLIHIMEEFRKIDLDSFQMVKGVDGKKLRSSLQEKRKGEIGCLRSHLSILKDAIDNGYEKIAVFEDDVIFCDDFKNRFDYYMTNIPADWDIMYLGNNIPIMLNPVTMVKKMIFRVWKSNGCFAMILNNKNGLFQKIIDVSKNEEKPIDVYIESLFPQLKCYTFIPFFVKISDIKSDINESSIYPNIDKYFKENMNLPLNVQNVQNVQNNVQNVHIEQIPVKTHKEMCDEHLKLSGYFEVYSNNISIFDSSTSSKENVLFFNDYFEVFGRRFSYRGMFIKRK